MLETRSITTILPMAVREVLARPRPERSEAVEKSY